jgi:hypothetical protein
MTLCLLWCPTPAWLPAWLLVFCCFAAAAEVKELEEKGELDDADPLGAFFKKIFSQVGSGSAGAVHGMCTCISLHA